MKKNQPIIRIEGITKEYLISHKALSNSHPTLKDQLGRYARKPLELIGAKGGFSREKFYALDNINLQIMPGDVVGLMGRNGSGKSTLLKILSKITQPSDGSIHMNGTVASLLEVGTGFHPELSGRENVYFNGSILGMSKKEIDKKFQSIVDFSEVEKFLDTPVKFYSSGMKIRLAFSVAAHLRPDILMIDEVLSVGDVKFKQKSLARMKDIAKSGTTIIFVSHVVSQFRKICTRGVVLESGEICFDGNLKDAISQYISLNDSSKDELGSKIVDEVNISKRDSIIEDGVEISVKPKLSQNLAGGDLPQLDLELKIVNNSDRRISSPFVYLIISDARNHNLASIGLNSSALGTKRLNHKEIININTRVRDVNLTPGKYNINFILCENGKTEDTVYREDMVASFDIKDYRAYGQSYVLGDRVMLPPVVLNYEVNN